MNLANFADVISVLDRMQAENIIEKFAIGEAFAAILHSEPISTIDLDVFFILSEKPDQLILSLDAVYEFARKRGFSFDHEFINIYGWLVQFVESSHSSLWKEAIETADSVKVETTQVLVIDKEHLVAMWLLAGRNEDYQKISMFWDAQILDHEKLVDILERHGLLVKWNNEKWRFVNEES